MKVVKENRFSNIFPMFVAIETLAIIFAMLIFEAHKGGLI